MKNNFYKIGLGLCLALLLCTSLSAQNDTLKAEQFFQEAKGLYYDGEYKEALKIFQKSLKIRARIYGENHEAIWKVYYRMGKANRRLRTHQDGLKALNKGLSIALKTQDENSIDIADFYFEIGAIYSQMYRPEKANEYYQKSLVVYKKEYGDESSEVGNIYMLFGNTSMKMGNYTDADKYYRRAHEVFKKSSKPTDKDFYRIYNNHGLMFRKIGDYEKAMTYAEKALEIKLLHYAPEHESVAKYYSNIGMIYKDKKEYETALSYFTTAVKLKEKALGKNHPETAGSYGSQGDMYAELGQFKKALKIYKKAIDIQEKKLRPGHPYLLAGYFNVGMTYEDMKDYDKALSYYATVLTKLENNEYTPPQLLARAQERVAEAHFANGNTTEALRNVRSGLKILVEEFNYEEKDFYTNPSLRTVQAELQFLDLLQSKSRFLAASFEKTQNKKDLEIALETSFLAIELVEKMRRSYQTQSAKEFLNSDTAPLYERAVQQAFDLYELTKDPTFLFKAFKASEQSKASILWQNINDQYAMESNVVSKNLADTLQSISDKIAALEYELNNIKNKSEDDYLNNKIFNLKINYEKRILELEKENPAYYQLKYAPAVVDAKVVIDHLPSRASAVVEYYYTKDQLFIFLCTKEGLKGFRKNISFDLEAFISLFRKTALQDLLTSQSQSQEYINRLNKLHDLLIEPILSQINEVGNLIIIPHGSLQLLSFEMLAPVEEEIDFRKIDYLLKKYNIQYAWSAALWKNKKEKNKKNVNSFVGFAPDFEIIKTQTAGGNETYAFRNNLVPLIHTASEIEAGRLYFNGEVFTKEGASKANFLKSAKESNILHLATHAIAEDLIPSQSGLLFSREGAQNEYGFLSLSEIYDLNLDADLAVMSACNTGYGQLAKGEGVMSLGRAFLYAGCKSIVMSLWLANDESTSFIMKNFYKHAVEGKSKNEALRMAKLDYLDQADALTAHPYFWANLVAVGDMAPLQKESRSYLWFYALALGIGLLLYFTYSKLK